MPRSVALLGLGASLQRRVQGLSGGETPRVTLGRALVYRPRRLLLDEPLSMLAVDRRDERLPDLIDGRERCALPMTEASHGPEEGPRRAEAVFRLPPVASGALASADR